MAKKYVSVTGKRIAVLAFAVLALVAVCSGASAQDQLAIKGGRIVPVSRPPIDGGVILIRDGKIEAIGKDLAIPSDCRVIDATGKVVLFNVRYTTYEETVTYRTDGPSRAARAGAAAVLVRSIGPAGLRTPHTGALQYAPDAPRIPAAAIASEDADRLQRMIDRGGRVVVRLKMEAHFEPDAESANVIGSGKLCDSGLNRRRPVSIKCFTASGGRGGSIPVRRATGRPHPRTRRMSSDRGDPG